MPFVVRGQLPSVASQQPAEADSGRLDALRFRTWSQNFYLHDRRSYASPARRRRTLPFASATAAKRSYKKEDCTRWLFSNIVGEREVLTIEDVRAFAQQHNLPSAYATSFFEAMTRSGSPNTSPTQVTYSVFKNYVNARESALRKVFNKIDKNRDGKVSRDEVTIGLAHLCITDPESRCCYKVCAPSEELRCTVCAVQSPSQSKQLPSTQSAAGNVQVTAPASVSDAISFCQFRKLFLLLPQDSMMVQYWNKAGDPSCYDLGCHVAFQDTQAKISGQDSPRTSAWGHLFAGATAGALSRTATAPLETLRIMAMTGKLHAGKGRHGSAAMVDAAVSLVQQRGWRALYQGNSANVIRSAPQKALDFFAFDAFKTALSPHITRAEGRPQAQPGTAATFAAAGLAGAVSSTLLYPLEVVRTRMSADTTQVYRGVGQAFSLIVQNEGVHALYRGVLPSVAAIIPEAAITYGLFDLLRRSYKKSMGVDDVGVVPSLTAGVAAALTGQLVAYPLETVSRRMQCHSTKLGVVEAIRGIIAEAGPAGLFRGVGAASVRVIPMAIVSFGAYELVREQYVKIEEYLELKAAEMESRALTSAPLESNV